MAFILALFMAELLLIQDKYIHEDKYPVPMCN